MKPIRRRWKFSWVPALALTFWTFNWSLILDEHGGLAWAKGGDEQGGGDNSGRGSGSDGDDNNSGSGSGGSDDDDSGNLGGGGGSGSASEPDAELGDNSGSGSDGADLRREGEAIRLYRNDGGVEQVRNGEYRHQDATGRLIERRRASQTDLARMSKAASATNADDNGNGGFRTVVLISEKRNLVQVIDARG